MWQKGSLQGGVAGGEEVRGGFYHIWHVRNQGKPSGNFSDRGVFSVSFHYTSIKVSRPFGPPLLKQEIIMTTSEGHGKFLRNVRMGRGWEQGIAKKSLQTITHREPSKVPRLEWYEQRRELLGSTSERKKIRRV